MVDRSRIMAKLYQGGCPSPTDDLTEFAVIVNCSYELRGPQYYRVPDAAIYIELGLRDSSLFAYEEEKVERVSDLLAGFVDRGGPVLVHCTQGWNRSGLVVARTLINIGYTPEAAIRVIRQNRHPMALCNANFTRYLQRIGPSVAADLAAQEEGDG